MPVLAEWLLYHLIPGKPKSIRTTSGLSSLIIFTPFSPSSASPTTSIPSNSFKDDLKQHG